MVVTLYMSRIVLNVLGVEDYGIYNVVGGVVMMFSMLSGALANAISRFITFELGKGDLIKLNKIFTTSVNILLILALIIFLLGAILGYWLVTTKLNIPTNRGDAAVWVLFCSLASFVLSLINVPYNACIIAHERMSAFAYISILDVLLKLLATLVISHINYDRLCIYSLLLLLVSILVQIVYITYCRHFFTETKYKLVYEKHLMAEISAFAGWGFLTNAAYILNTQGISILVNLFFGVSVNAARGIAMQVETAVMKFVNDFTTAINPQITKEYAQGNLPRLYLLVCSGAKYGFFLLLVVSLPVIMETDIILSLWLGTVPNHTVAFVRLAIIATMIDRLGMTGYTACMATGTIKKYVLCITSVGILPFPITYLVYKLGAPVESTYIVFALVYVAVDAVRLWIMKGLLDFPVMIFVNKVVVKIFSVGLLAVVIPFVILIIFSDSILRLVLMCIVCVCFSVLSIFFVGLEREEKDYVVNIVRNRIYRKK